MPRPQLRVRLLALIFFLSGFASLVYQVAWQRLLTVHYGVGTASITLIVCVYMFGLGVGGWFGGWLASRTRRRVELYLATELGLALFGLASLPLLDALGRGTAGASLLAAGATSFAFLAIPTTLMGMTLPLVVQIFDDQESSFGSTVSLLYGLNTLGAAAGALGSAYGLISFGGLDVAIWVAAAMNLGLGGLIFLVRSAPPPAADAPGVSAALARSPLGRTAWLLVFVTGFLAIGYEIVWVRLIGVLVKASPYAFATVLFTYLLGIAAGGFALRSALRRGLDDPQSLFFLLQFLLGASTLLLVGAYYHATLHTDLSWLTRYSFAQDLHPPRDLFLPSGSGLFKRTAVFLWPAFFVLGPTVLMGASFPLVAHLAYARRGSEGATIGTLYFFNLAGNVVGGAATGLLVLPAIGTEHTLLVFSIVGLLAGFLARRALGRRIPLVVRAATVGLLVAAGLATFPGRGALYRVIHAPSGPSLLWEEHMEEGLDGVVVSYSAWPRLENYINGLAHGGRPPYAFFRETIEAAAHVPRARDVLVIGFGTGGIVEAAQKTDAERIVLVELSATLLRNLRKIAPLEAILDEPRTELWVDDARRYLLRTERRFDLVLMDPLRTTTAYSNNLYSVEFFELVREHLRPGGVLLIWTDELRVLPSTVASVFPHLRLWSFFLVASDSPLEADPAWRAELLARFPATDRRAIEAVDVPELGDRAWVERHAAGVPTNHDRRPVAEYYLRLPARD